MPREPGTILGESVRKTYASKGDDCTFSRFVKTHKRNKRTPRYQWKLPTLAHPSIEEGRSLFYRKGVKSVGDDNVLVSGHSNVKIGRDVRKGKRFRGYWIFTLTLEERATCPRYCAHWQTCYGNNMPFTKRRDHRDEDKLRSAIERDIKREINKRGRKGILVRLHALGDFFSVDYVEWWASMLVKYDRLAVFGYTAYLPGSSIGEAIRATRDVFEFRFSIRNSNNIANEWATETVVRPFTAKNAIQCPEQIDASDGCGKCGLCWNTKRNIAFVQH